MSAQTNKQDPSPISERRRSWPAVSEDTEFFWNGVRDGELRIQQCSDCAALSHPPKPICSACGSFALGHLVVSGAGTVYSHVTFHKPLSQGFDEPYNVSVVELEEGVRLVSQVVGVKPSEVSIGMSVEVEFAEVEPGLVLPQFHPVAETDGKDVSRG
ncbi:Zn-ribbon domain-containing OB-fold protein [Rhodococcus artemisiae]|uniref:Zn-ribbon domain-containing OB-fold protein n=1 Tax=Rhodococcus artemisiae TaxID=714159 RepID=A0ABU7LCB7_9NOCA|nr:Zn-ribbon domain-containing OB-fold protein [Rhodococcus artemisiae]MEE2059191.1 Zn-ribbon domain-containing OB-fold protein [Rhodococcus artemisiae]